MDPVPELTALLEARNPVDAFYNRSAARAATAPRRTVALDFNCLVKVVPFAETPLTTSPYTTPYREPADLGLTQADIQLHLDAKALLRHMAILLNYLDDDELPPAAYARIEALAPQIRTLEQMVTSRIAQAARRVEAAHLRRRHALAAFGRTA